VRRLAVLFVAVACSACPLPEDTFVVSGTAQPDVEVQLLRNKFASKSRCDALEPLQTTMADADGRFSFSVLRQEITGGENDRRFFSVEFKNGESTSRLVRRFWFPDADLELGPWSAPDAVSYEEVALDGAIVWRTDQFAAPEFVLDRDYQRRGGVHSFEWKEVPIDSLGRVDFVPVETRQEFDWSPAFTSTRESPPSRGGECPFIDVKPCPLTDGRFLPFTLPPGSRSLVFNFKRDFLIHNFLFHGLVLERPATRVRYDFNFVVDYEQWNPGGSVPVSAVAVDRASEHCDAPGAFLALTPPNVRALILRVSFVDERDEAVPIVSLAEITAQ
jgi:hypothetical protein